MEGEKSPMSYYGDLGVSSRSSFEDIKRAYRKLAMQWHPDRWTQKPYLLGKAKRRFQQIQEAYSVLSDRRKRTLYDAGLYDPEDEEDEGFADFVSEMMSLMAEERRQEKSYSMEELRKMFMELAGEFEYCAENIGTTKRARYSDSGSAMQGNYWHPNASELNWGTYLASSFCK